MSTRYLAGAVIAFGLISTSISASAQLATIGGAAGGGVHGAIGTTGSLDPQTGNSGIGTDASVAARDTTNSPPASVKSATRKSNRSAANATNGGATVSGATRVDPTAHIPGGGN